jgi:hypothetical protein
MRFGFGMLVGICRAIPRFSHFEKNISDYKTDILFLHRFSPSRLLVWTTMQYGGL